MMKSSIPKRNNKGFTLIELLISVVLFVVITGISANVFLSGFQGQKRALAFQTITDQSSYFMEYASRALRMAQKELGTPPACLSLFGYNYEITRSGQGVKFINSLGECQEFYLDASTKRLKENILGQGEQFLTAASAEVTIFKINSTDAGQDSKIQPRVSLYLVLQKKGEKAESKSVLRLQTTISQRNLNIQY